ncbi:MAG: cytochrome P450 [Myxococcota bacterium]
MKSMTSRDGLPAGPRNLLMTARGLMGKPYGFYGELAERYGSPFTVRLPGIPPYVVFTKPAAIKELMTLGYDTAYRLNDVSGFLTGPRSILFQEGGDHRRLRSVLSGPFHVSRVGAYGSTILEVTDAVIDQWQPGASIRLMDVMHEITLRVMLRCVVGASDPDQVARLEMLFQRYFARMLTPQMMSVSMVVGSLRLFDILDGIAGVTRRFRSRVDDAVRVPVLEQGMLRGFIDEILYEEIDRCRQGDMSEREDILARIVMASEDVDLAQTHALLMDFLGGGFSTTSVSLSWAMYSVLEQPEVAARIRDEVGEVFGDGPFEPRRAGELQYLTAVMRESARLHPIMAAIFRVVRNDAVIDGTPLEAGTAIGIPAPLIQRSPELYEAPDTFDPSRFLGKRPPPFAYIPFGGGPWRCLGSAFAEYEMQIVIARILMRASLVPDYDSPLGPQMHGFLVAPSGGLAVRVANRTRARA